MGTVSIPVFKGVPYIKNDCDTNSHELQLVN